MQVNGTFRYITINPAILTALTATDRPAALRGCADWLIANPGQTLVASVTGYFLDDAKISNSMKSEFTSKLTASLAGKASDSEIAKIETSFEKEVEKTAELTFSKYFELLTVGRYPEKTLQPSGS